MVEIEQRKIPDDLLISPFNKEGFIELKFNKSLIQKDIGKLENELKLNRYKNKYDKENLKRATKYLNRIIKKLDNEHKIEICWNMEDNVPDTYPISFIKEPLYGVNTCNYLEIKDNEKIVEIETKSLADLIAFEIMYKDLGESHDTIENLLYNCGIIGYEKADPLLDYFKENNDDIYELSKTMRIEDTPYMYLESKKVHDYFYITEFNGKEYRDVVNFSCKYANAIIMNSILNNGATKGKLIRPLMINATSIAFITDIEYTDDINEVLIGDISVRIFGRRFRIEPEIQIL